MNYFVMQRSQSRLLSRENNNYYVVTAERTAALSANQMSPTVHIVKQTFKDPFVLLVQDPAHFSALTQSCWVAWSKLSGPVQLHLSHKNHCE